MIEGTTFQLAVKGLYADGSETDVTSQAAYTVKGNSGALEVNATGLVSALKPGSGTISIVFDGKIIELKIIVSPEESGGKGNNGSNGKR